MAYKMVDELEKLCGRVAGAAIEHRALITQTLTQRFKDKLIEGQTAPDIFQLQTWLAEELYDIHAKVVATESALKAELTVDRQDRTERGRFVSEVRQHLFSARSIFDALYGAGGSAVMFQEPPGFRVRIDPVPLYRQGVTVHDNILDANFRRPPLRFDLDVDLVKLARGMEPGLTGLGRTLAVLRTGTQASNASFAAKESEMAVLDKRTGLAARLLEALFAWAGHEGIARRVRLSSHRTAAVGSTPAVEAPAAQTPEGETPEGEAPEGEAPEGKVPEGETPASETPSGGAPDDAKPVDDALTRAKPDIPPTL